MALGAAAVTHGRVVRRHEIIAAALHKNLFLRLATVIVGIEYRGHMNVLANLLPGPSVAADPRFLVSGFGFKLSLRLVVVVFRLFRVWVLLRAGVAVP